MKANCDKDVICVNCQQISIKCCAVFCVNTFFRFDKPASVVQLAGLMKKV